MRIDVQLFALLRQRVGAAVLALEVPEGATVGDLRRALAEARPDLAPLVPTLHVAVDSEYADDARTIAPGSEVAAFPPVSGGAPRSPASRPRR
ncbi:MAG TPA: MoaD/ThiS family protein [Isosphaeraceae bacterium]|nr:MoaD/ThiS family protein [Isosphaeraceae bacterium]